MKKNTVLIGDDADEDWKCDFVYQQTGDRQLTLEGHINGNAATIKLHRVDSSKWILVTRGFEDGRFVFFVTRKGVVKRTDLNAFSNVRSAGIIALGVDDGDSLVAVFITDGTKDVLLSTAQGMSIRFAVFSGMPRDSR